MVSHNTGDIIRKSSAIQKHLFLSKDEILQEKEKSRNIGFINLSQSVLSLLFNFNSVSV